VSNGSQQTENKEAKMEVDVPTGVVKEEKMDVDEEKTAEEEKEKEPTVLLSGLESSERKQMTEIVTRLGGRLTETPGDCSHLVMSKLSRTNNFLQCLPTVKFVLSVKWLVESDAENKFLSEDSFTMEDPVVEAKFNFSLAKTLSRASRDKLFSGKVFYLTPSVEPSMSVLTNIITASGGRVENRRRKTTDQMKEFNSGGSVNYIVITCEEDIHLVTDVLRAKLGVFNSEFVLDAVTRCEMDFDLSRYLTTT